MGLKVADFTLSRNSLPTERSNVGIRLVRQTVVDD